MHGKIAYLGLVSPAYRSPEYLPEGAPEPYVEVDDKTDRGHVPIILDFRTMGDLDVPEGVQV